MARDVFISFASEDRTVATQICARLEETGLSCFISHRDIPPGAEWTASIVEGIQECRIFLLVFSSHANRSPHVTREAERALSAGKKMLAFRLEKSPLSNALEYCTGGSQWIDAGAQPEDEDLKKLAAALLSMRRPLSKLKMAGWAAAVLVILLAILAWFRPGAGSPARSGEKTLSYSIVAHTVRNGEAREETVAAPGGTEFRAGDKLRIRLAGAQEGHLYVLNEGPQSGPGKRDYNLLFPAPTANGGSPLLRTGQRIDIPGSGWFQFDAQPGVERVWLIWSVESVPELETVRRFANEKDAGAISDAGAAAAVESVLAKPPHQAVLSAPAANGEVLLKTQGTMLIYRIDLLHRGVEQAR
jgi:hypothetical protein